MSCRIVCFVSRKAALICELKRSAVFRLRITNEGIQKPSRRRGCGGSGCRLGVISPAFSIMHFDVEMILKLHYGMSNQWLEMSRLETFLYLRTHHTGQHDISINSHDARRCPFLQKGIFYSFDCFLSTASSSTPQRLVSLQPWPPRPPHSFLMLEMFCFW